MELLRPIKATPSGFIEDLSVVQRFGMLPNYSVLYFRQFTGSSCETILSFAAKCPNLLTIIFDGDEAVLSDLTRRHQGKAQVLPITPNLWKNSYQERIWDLLISDYFSQALNYYDD